ncbi:MAG TPA: expansin EXLX1 family cellulose-binding protein [Polyangiaceae bacterium]
MRPSRRRAFAPSVALVVLLGCEPEPELEIGAAAALRPSVRALLLPRCPKPAEQRGEATFYTFAHRMGNCSLEPVPGDMQVGALNTAQYARSAACGACVRIAGPKGETTVRIVDRCPRCRHGDIDLSRAAFERIADCAEGRVSIRWRFVPCAVRGQIRYHFARSRYGWTALQVRNHRHAVAKLEWLDGADRAVPLERQNHNYFTRVSKMGPGPYTLRVTDVHGNTLTDARVQDDSEEVAGSAQFPACAP